VLRAGIVDSISLLKQETRGLARRRAVPYSEMAGSRRREGERASWQMVWVAVYQLAGPLAAMGVRLLAWRSKVGKAAAMAALADQG
jgi:hypothetical protein